MLMGIPSFYKKSISHKSAGILNFFKLSIMLASIVRFGAIMSLQPKDVAKVAHLARLALNEADISKYSENLTNILGFIEQMNEIDTSHIEPMAHPLDAQQRLRPDVVTETDQRELFQTLTTHTEAGLYLVPQVIETKLEE